MRILLVHRYYWPDTPAYAQMLHLMAKRFVEAGHEVTVFSTQPSYNDSIGQKLPGRETVDGVTIYRTPLLKEQKTKLFVRAINVVLFCASLACHWLLRWGKYDLMTVASFPPTIMGVMARWLTWLTGSRYLYHCQDLYPETAQATGLIRRPWLGRLAKRVDTRTCQHAAGLVTLSGDMVSTLCERGLSDTNFTVINNFIIDKLDSTVELPESLVRPTGKFRIVFAGNMGRFQNLPNLLDAAKSFSDNDMVEFCFVGGGALTQQLRDQAGECLGKTIHFFPFQPLPIVLKLLSDAQLAIVSLSPNVIYTAYPSKTMSYVEAGCRILAVIEPDTELAHLIRSEDLGTVCEETSVTGIRAAIQKEVDSGIQNANEGRASLRAIGEKHFSQETILQRWVDLLAQLEETEH